MVDTQKYFWMNEWISDPVDTIKFYKHRRLNLILSCFLGKSRLSAARLSSVFKLQAKGPSADCQKPSSSDVKSFSVLPSVFCRNTEALSFHRAMKPIVTVLGTYSEVNRDRLSMQHFEILFILNLSIAPLNAIIHIPRPKQIRIVCDLVYCLSLWLAGLLHGDFVLTTVGI